MRFFRSSSPDFCQEHLNIICIFRHAEPTHRFCEGKLVSEGENKRSDESPQSISRADDEEARERVLAKTVEQLRSLVKDGECVLWRDKLSEENAP